MTAATRQSIGAVTLVVRDYDEAKAWFVDVLGFDQIEDRPMEEGKRWVVVAPRGSGGTRILLARAANAEQRVRIGAQAGGRVFLFLHTDDFDRDFMEMSSRGIGFLEAPRSEPYGKVAVFADLYGNRWDLIQPA